jgi:hypothetical protein
MSVHTNAQLCFGVAFEEGTEFPWDEAHDGDVESWWLEQTGFAIELMYNDETDDFLPGWDRARVDDYYLRRKAHEEAHPLPIELVNVCMGDNPIWMLAVPGTLREAWRGEPVAIKVCDLRVHLGALERFLSFCETYGIDFPADPEWYLSSYWG